MWTKGRLITAFIGLLLFSRVLTLGATDTKQAVQGAHTHSNAVTATATPQPTNTPSPTATPSLTPTQTPEPTINTAPTYKRAESISSPANSPSTSPQTQDSLSNENYYTNSQGDTVHSPADSTNNSVPAGATAKCADGTYSFSESRRGTCSHHGGVASWL